MPYGDNSFDTVFCSEVIEHVSTEDALGILREIARVISPGGRIILTTPYDERLEDALVRCPSCDCSFHRYGHQYSFKEEDFFRLFSESGLEPENIFPVKMSRVNRYRILGRSFFRSEFMIRRSRRMGGKRTLIGIARKAGH